MKTSSKILTVTIAALFLAIVVLSLAYRSILVRGYWIQRKVTDEYAMFVEGTDSIRVVVPEAFSPWGSIQLCSTFI